jgi:hypothetical protein
VSTSPIITANWEADSDNTSTVPIGGGGPREGTPFTAYDVVFSIERAGAETSDLPTQVGRIAKVEAMRNIRGAGVMAKVAKAGSWKPGQSGNPTSKRKTPGRYRGPPLTPCSVPDVRDRG